MTIALAAIAIVLPDLINGYRLFLATLIVVFATAGVGLVIIMGWTGQIALAHVAFMGIGAYGTNWLFSDLGMPWVIYGVWRVVPLLLRRGTRAERPPQEV